MDMKSIENVRHNEGNFERRTGRNRTRDHNDTNRDFFKQMPKLPYFDGQTSWKTFMNTFELYSKANGWNVQIKFDAIQLCMRDKAVDFLRSQQKLGKCQDYDSLVEKLKKRFERQQDPFIKRSEFLSLQQTHEESIEEWADRVLELGLEAFDQLSDESREEELVRKFSMGCSDKDSCPVRNKQQTIQSGRSNHSDEVPSRECNTDFGEKESSLY